MTTIVRAQVAHTPRNPFVHESALEAFHDGAVAFSAGRILACGPYGDVRARHPDAEVLDARGAISVTERAAYIGRIRALSRQVATAYVESREALGFPMLPAEQRKAVA